MRIRVDERSRSSAKAIERIKIRMKAASKCGARWNGNSTRIALDGTCRRKNKRI